MSFLFPTFLFGLLAIAVPVIIHLFNFRKYKKVYFTNVQFLKELKQESDSKSKLKEWLILAMRVLVITCLVFAFAQPFLPGKTKLTKGETAVSVYVDNSFSMESVNKQGTLLENAKTYAAEIVNSFSASDKFQLLTNDFEGRHQRFVSKDEFLEQLNEVKISSATKTIEDVLHRQQDFLRNSTSKNKTIFVLSDFQINHSYFDKSVLDTSITFRFIPISSEEINNVYIDSVWFESPVQQFGTTQTIHASIVNSSKKDIENATLKLFINDRQVSLNSFNASAGVKKDVSISFTIKNKGINKAALKIEDYPVTYDDIFYFSFNAHAKVNALVINGKESLTGANFHSLMNDDSLFVLQENNEVSIDYSVFSKTNIIVLNELSILTTGLVSELQKFISNGGCAVVFPSKKADFTSYNAAFSVLGLPQMIRLDTVDVKTQQINFEQGLYEGVFEKIDQSMDLPKIFNHFEFTNTTNSSTQKIVVLNNGDFLLSANLLEKGKVYLFSVPSDKTCSNFLNHALFVPTLIRMSILSINPSPIYYKTAVNEAILLNDAYNFADKPLHIIKDKVLSNSTNVKTQVVDIIPEHRLINKTTVVYTQNQIMDAGYYSIFNGNDFVKDLAFNFNREESNMNFMTKQSLQEMIDKNGINNVEIIEPSNKKIIDALNYEQSSSKLWKLFLVLALVFIGIEILIILLFKN